MAKAQQIEALSWNALFEDIEKLRVQLQEKGQTELKRSKPLVPLTSNQQKTSH